MNWRQKIRFSMRVSSFQNFFFFFTAPVFSVIKMKNENEILFVLFFDVTFELFLYIKTFWDVCFHILPRSIQTPFNSYPHMQTFVGTKYEFTCSCFHTNLNVSLAAITYADVNHCKLKGQHLYERRKLILVTVETT